MSEQEQLLLKLQEFKRKKYQENASKKSAVNQVHHARINRTTTTSTGTMNQTASRSKDIAPKTNQKTIQNNSKMNTIDQPSSIKRKINQTASNKGTTLKTSRNTLQNNSKTNTIDSTPETNILTSKLKQPTKFTVDIATTMEKVEDIEPNDILVKEQVVAKELITNSAKSDTRFIFKDKLSLCGLDRIIAEVGEAVEIIAPPRLLLFSIHDGIKQGELGNQKLFRSIFNLLSTLELNPKYNYIYYHNEKYRLFKKPYYLQHRFWTAWAFFEEKWGNLSECADVYFEAIDRLKDREEIMKLREEYYAAQMRIGTSKHVEFEDEELAPPELLSDTFIHHVKQEEIESDIKSLWNQDSVDPVVQLEKNKLVTEIVEMLDGLRISNPTPVKKPLPDFTFDLPIKTAPKTPGKKVVGVPVNARKDGSSVTVLTPIKASKKNKIELGVEHVITPVRRSLRFFQEEDYVTHDKENDGNKAPVREKVVELLEHHGYAYVPNKNVQFKLDMIRNRSDLNLQETLDENNENH